MAHALNVLKQITLGLERNRVQIEETAETGKELYKKTRPQDKVQIGMDPLREVCPTEEK